MDSATRIQLYLLTRLVGSAAGVDSLFGKGIKLALAYGNLTAEVIKKGSQQFDLSFRYFKRCLLTYTVRG